ncbi:hypothetical protein DEO72_LG8g1099 [Vigna unguiculata]|uniref:Uncharacterized protein n=1 Tax=Vigna unguiculata TaxID=3917 RepID=A0A4D6MNH3_VIGUN|nr:hypothetical protein DEO72_LG8g1099 [Vigna unguiculata]
MGAYKHLNNSVVNLTQAQEFSLKLAHLAQVRGLRSRKHSKPKGMLVESTGTYGNEPKTLEAYSRAENSEHCLREKEKRSKVANFAEWAEHERVVGPVLVAVSYTHLDVSKRQEQNGPNDPDGPDDENRLDNPDRPIDTNGPNDTDEPKDWEGPMTGTSPTI